MIEFKELLEQDSAKVHDFPDERLISNLRLTSLSKALRSISAYEEIIKNSNDKNEIDRYQKLMDEEQEKNNWLFDEANANGKISTINFDVLKDLCKCDELKSCDAFFYDGSGSRKSFLLEFKNCSKAKLSKTYLTDTEDGILPKIKDSKHILTEQIRFNGKDTEDELVSQTHIIIVYGGKNDMPLLSIPPTSAKKSKKSGSGKQNKPVSFAFNKRESEENDKFGLAVKNFGFSQCLKEDFPVPGEPDFKKEKGNGKIRNYTLFSSVDFKELIEKGFFDQWGWGEYAPYF